MGRGNLDGDRALARQKAWILWRLAANGHFGCFDFVNCRDGDHDIDDDAGAVRGMGLACSLPAFWFAGHCGFCDPQAGLGIAEFSKAAAHSIGGAPAYRYRSRDTEEADAPGGGGSGSRKYELLCDLGL